MKSSSLSDQSDQNSPETDPLTEAAISLLQAANWLNAQISQHLDPLDLTLQQLKILSIIYRSSENKATVNQIKQQMIDPSSNVSRLLNKLMDKGLIEKIRNREDQRVVHIHISKAGIRMMCTGKQAMDQGMSVLGKLDLEELKQLDKLMNKLRA
ncbi:MarR family winged helix-turn-helix transcriptional regulator [Motiliproteus sp. MSK22-1]|uniref:MarR family winged helix-turn-helix transcriptional regulator n=1 Tax=Motiliproteus sp. MSK22-1 TaxID=1897630 RepID=UPI0009767744|nr:MarR family transcriptional regulator [Motiliproteus sp. MSK22-1]OMH33876.1 hypothetical protein BGP75_12915 [Motiliproteus sp. MSK22-1]